LKRNIAHVVSRAEVIGIMLCSEDALFHLQLGCCSEKAIEKKAGHVSPATRGPPKLKVLMLAWLTA